MSLGTFQFLENFRHFQKEFWSFFREFLERILGHFSGIMQLILDQYQTVEITCCSIRAVLA